jgi:putative acetyltransferase
MDILIRSERPTDQDVIRSITIAAFAGKAYSQGTEHLIVDGLRDANALTVSLVAEMGDSVVGHAAFSAVTIDGADLGWYGLGPISVQPEFQLQGIGSKLVRQGLNLLQELGAKGCVLEGGPQYYGRFGFKSRSGLTYAGAPAAEYFMALPFTNDIPQGSVEFHQAFYITG